MLPDDRLDVDLALFDSQWLAIGSGGRDLGRRIEPQQQPAGFVALEDDVEKPGVAVLMLHCALGLLRSWLTIDGGNLAWLLRALIASPRFSLDTCDSLQLQISGRVEVPNRALSPGDGCLLDVLADRRLADVQFPRDSGLTIALEIQVRHLLTAQHNGHFAGRLNAHGGSS